MYVRRFLEKLSGASDVYKFVPCLDHFSSVYYGKLRIVCCRVTSVLEVC